MAVHFKFRSAVEYDSVGIDGHFISIANLKEKIVEQKSLGKGADFDLVITNAQSGEEYTDDNQLLPKNTSVIIKRVPATRSKLTLQVHDQVKVDVSGQTSGADNRFVDGIPSASAASVCFFTSQNAELDDMDAFGVDLYSVPNPVPTRTDIEVKSKILDMVNETTSDWHRDAQDAFGSKHGYGRRFAGGYAYGRAIPPQGYTCHRCGQPGHFIQHCPTNGDPAYDRKRVIFSAGIPKAKLKVDEEGPYTSPDASVFAITSDVTAFAKETDSLLISRPTLMEPPAELRCPLCLGIFKEAVMIPCCHYSFCDRCIRQALIEKGECPQCGCPKFKNDDLLPNIALQQAIDHFLEAQQAATSVEVAAAKQQVPDVESASQAKVSSPDLLGVKIEHCKTIVTNATASGAEMVEKEQNLAVTAESVCESAVESREKDVVIASTIVIEAPKALEPVNILHNPDESDAVDSPATKQNDNVADHTVVKVVSHLVRGGDKQPVSHIGESAMGSKIFEPPSPKEVEGVALEFEASKGKKKKKRSRLVPADGLVEHLITGRPRKGDRFCYVCGSPDHLARDCTMNTGSFPPHHGIFRPGVPVPPNGMPPYVPEIYWHGPPVPHVRPFPLGYSEGLYGPSPMGMPFEAPMIHVGPYGIPPYMAPIYHTATMHAGFMGGIGPTMMVRMERPLSREEFLELQERERRRRLMQDYPGREHSQEGPYSRDGDGQARFPDSEQKLYDQRRMSMDEQLSFSRNRELDQHSVQNYSDESDHCRINGSKHGRKIERLSKSHGRWMCESASDDEITYDDSKSRRSHVEGPQRDAKAVYSEVRKEIRHHHQVSGENLSSELEDGEQSYSPEIRDRSPRKDEHVRLSNHISSKRHGDSSLKRHADSRSRRHADVSSRKYECGSFKKYDDRSIYTEVMVVEDSHFNHRRSKKSVSEDFRHGCHSEKRDWKKSKYECLEAKEWHSTCDYSDYNNDNARDGEICKGSSYQCHSRSKNNPDTVDYELEDVSSKKKKKTHRRHREHSQEMDQHVSYEFLEDGVIVEPSKHRKNKSINASPLLARNSSQMSVSSLRSPIEESRWQMDSGFDRGDNLGHNSHWPRHKLQHAQSGKSRSFF
eukprot:c28890_g1_i5 orf=401-3727(+)